MHARSLQAGCATYRTGTSRSTVENKQRTTGIRNNVSLNHALVLFCAGFGGRLSTGTSVKNAYLAGWLYRFPYDTSSDLIYRVTSVWITRRANYFLVFHTN
jgi:hypothetical protein